LGTSLLAAPDWDHRLGFGFVVVTMRAGSVVAGDVVLSNDAPGGPTAGASFSAASSMTLITASGVPMNRSAPVYDLFGSNRIRLAAMIMNFFR
jgi:hypothetical protein